MKNMNFPLTTHATPDCLKTLTQLLKYRMQIYYSKCKVHYIYSMQETNTKVKYNNIYNNETKLEYAA